MMRDRRAHRSRLVWGLLFLVFFGLLIGFEGPRAWAAPASDGASESGFVGSRSSSIARVRAAEARLRALEERFGLGPWMEGHAPEWLLLRGPFELRYWQLLLLPFVLALGALVGQALTRATCRGIDAFVRRTAAGWDDSLLAELRGPLALGWTFAAVRLLLGFLDLSTAPATGLHKGVRVVLLLSFFWVLLRVVDLSAALVTRSTWALSHPASRALVPLAMRVAEVSVVAIGIVALLSELGYPVASLLAGLGIGGLALALAAQKTVENLFGAFSIGADQLFREGDTVKVEDFTGEVESIGLRSTKFRTPDRTLITIPNGKLAEMKVESISARDRIRFACDLTLVYGTRSEQLREILQRMEDAIRRQPKIWPQRVIVRLKALADSGVVIELGAWFVTGDHAEFQALRQELLFELIAVVEQSGSALAYPTQTLVLSTDGRVSADGRVLKEGLA